MAVVTKGDEGKRPMGEEQRSGSQSETRQQKTPATRGGFFHVYKPGQGYWTRMGTAAAALVLVALFGQFLYQKLSLIKVGESLALDGSVVPEYLSTQWVLGIVAAVLVGLALVGWYYLNKPMVVDFQIATESEMKKVNWTSRKDLIGSTKVVILFMFLIAAILFVVDLVFSWIFGLILNWPFRG